MRLSKSFFPTFKDVKETDIVQKVILKAGMIKQVASGIYSFGPLGLAILKEIERIIREEMKRINCFEVLLPLMTPADLWKESGRWFSYGSEMIRFKDKEGRDFCLPPTHEEIMVDLVRNFLTSYKFLPLKIFQIGQKFRDEPRPRFGLIRCREFIMKDAYSFDIDEESAEKTYEEFFSAYKRIFERLELDVLGVKAAVGLIGGKFSNEFILPSEFGEDYIVKCSVCGYISKKEIGEFIPKKIEGKFKEKKKVYTPKTTTVEKLAEYLKIQKEEIIKTLLVKTKEKGEYILIAVRGEREISEEKLSKYIGEFEIAEEDEVRKEFSAGKGFIGPLNWKGRIIVDKTILHIHYGVCGADEDDYHFVGINPGIDFPINDVADVALPQEGDNCICGKGSLKEIRGLEVGHIFFLGKRYSEPMKLKVLKDGKEIIPDMGCYGIGVSRLIPAIIEKNMIYDKFPAIFLPYEVAPFKIHIIPLIKDEEVERFAEEIYENFKDISILDDREFSPGEKLADADLMGAPIRIVVGKKIKENKIEILTKERKIEVEKEKVAEFLKKEIKEKRK